MLMYLFRPAVLAGRPITVVPLNQRAPSASGTLRGGIEQRVNHRGAQRRPTAYRTTCENPWVRLRRTTSGGAAAGGNGGASRRPARRRGRRHHTPPPSRGLAVVNQLLLAQPLVVGGCVTPPAHQLARDSAPPAAVEQQLGLVLALLSRVGDGPRAGGAPTRSNKGLRRSTLTVGLQRMRRGSARV